MKVQVGRCGHFCNCCSGYFHVFVVVCVFERGKEANVNLVLSVLCPGCEAQTLLVLLSMCLPLLSRVFIYADLQPT